METQNKMVKSNYKQHLDSSLNVNVFDTITAKLLVFGYIRLIENKLNNIHNMIPQSIYKLCYEYYYFMSLVLLYKYNKSTKINSFGIFNNNKINNIINIKLKKFKKKTFRQFMSHFSNFCFIPNISTLFNKNVLKNDSNRYHGIFALISDSTSYQLLSDYISYPVLILFNNEYNVFYEFESIKFIKGFPGQFVFCGSKNGIIYEYNGNLYQLKLKNIKWPKPNRGKLQIIFKQIQTKKNNNKLFWDFSTKNIGIKHHYLQICYIETENKIFAIECYNNECCTKHRAVGLKSKMETNVTVKCGIFNFKTKKWKEIKPFIFDKVMIKPQFTAFMYYDIINKLIFMITYQRDTAIYDLMKNEWKILCNESMRMSAFNGYWNRGTKIVLFGGDNSNASNLNINGIYNYLINDSYPSKSQISFNSFDGNKWSNKSESIKSDKDKYYVVFQ